VNYVLYLALALDFYMAWSIGSNDAANAMGTSVGSKASTFKEAVVIAAVFEFGGASITGGDVANTMRKGIVDPTLYNQSSLLPAGNGAELFALGMMAALVAAAIWLHISAFLGWPVSTTHSIVGAITGFGVISLGADQIAWWKLGKIVAGWFGFPLPLMRGRKPKPVPWPGWGRPYGFGGRTADGVARGTRAWTGVGVTSRFHDHEAGRATPGGYQHSAPTPCEEPKGRP
jgi:hypothetical protein